MNVKDLFKKVKGQMLVIPDTEWIDGEFAKDLRINVFGMSQNAFAKAVGLKKKTIEKWESGSIKPSGSARKLLYILKEKPELMKELYRFEDESSTGFVTFSFIEPKDIFYQNTLIQMKNESNEKTYVFESRSKGSVNYA